MVPEEDAEMIADDDSGNEYCYGKQGFPKQEAEPPAREWFGAAILRQGLGCGLEYLTVRDADGNLIWTGKGVQESAAQGHEEDTDAESSIRRTRLVEAMRSLTPEMLGRLVELKAQGEQLRSRPDLIWRLVLESFSTMGNSRGYEGLFGNRGVGRIKCI